jgi:aminoglycoside/choline kinase family phosphotransferase
LSRAGPRFISGRHLYIEADYRGLGNVDERLEGLKRWLDAELRMGGFDIRPASSDASFRRYFRVSSGPRSFIVMDAPPAKEDSRPFIDVARRLLGLGLNVPEVLEADLDRGYLLLSDLGNQPYLGHLDRTSADRLYGDAMGALVVLQAGSIGADTGILPPYDRELLWREMELFREWYLGRHLGLAPTEGQDEALNEAFEVLAAAALEQPRVWVHRDYHSRNLMVTTRNNPGILDFQDAVLGPVTYDLVSLLRDCYVAWPREQVEDWAKGYYDVAAQSGLPTGDDEEQFLRWFDLMGVQRHLKASGIFARLNYRDGKPNYLPDIPRTLGYVMDVAARYPELRDFHRLLVDLGLPEVGGR